MEIFANEIERLTPCLYFGYWGRDEKGRENGNILHFLVWFDQEKRKEIGKIFSPLRKNLPSLFPFEAQTEQT